MGGSRNPYGCKVALFGVPYDGTTSFRPGARFGPNAIREVSHGLETYCPQLNLELEEIAFADLGALDIPFGAPEPVISKVKEASKEIHDLGLKPLMLGGEHSITPGAVSAAVEKYPDLVLIQIDAHADLREQWQGSKYNHACAMRRCLDVLPSGDLLQLDIRSGTKKEFQELHKSKRLINNAQELREKLIAIAKRPIYLTIDLDWFDPSILPGTGTPEPGGYLWKDFSDLVDILRDHRLVAADIVELAPQLDHSGVSSILAAKVVRTLLLLLGNSQ